VLNHITFSTEPGIYGILGVNGAGKTTLIRIMTGLCKPDGGRVLFHGTDIFAGSGRRHVIRSTQASQKELHRNLGYMPQQSVYYPNYTVGEFLKYICVIKEIPRKECAARVEKVLTEVNLMQERKKKIWKLSGGMRQRLGIAQAILNEPEIVILDEPTAGLDPNERVRFRSLIQKISENRTVLLATHIVEDVERIAQKVILLHNHEILVEDKPANLIQNIPQSDDREKAYTLEDYFFWRTNGEIEND
jgi:ABC-2 type transport system ATP-binding protein